MQLPSPPARSFASDNAAGVAPPILEALQRANTGFAFGYGDDDATRRVEKRFAELFERDVSVFLLPTGTGANALALERIGTNARRVGVARRPFL